MQAYLFLISDSIAFVFIFFGAACAALHGLQAQGDLTDLILWKAQTHIILEGGPRWNDKRSLHTEGHMLSTVPVCNMALLDVQGKIMICHHVKYKNL